MMKIKLKFLLMVVAVAVLSSCGTSKNVAYFKDLDKYEERFKSTDFYKNEPKIKPNDQLMINVSSTSLFQEKVAQFNLPVSSYLTPGETTVTPSTSYPTYYVDKDGTVDFPVLGKLKLAGMTRAEARDYIKKLVSDYIKEGAIVNLQIASFNISVHGEVFKPGPIKMENDKISVLDALGAAGGITVYGDKQKILLIRDNNGSIEHYKFDLTQADIFNSPYFYLHQNDVLFVESTKARMKDSEYGAAENYKLTRISVLTSAISTFTTIITVLIINRR